MASASPAQAAVKRPPVTTLRSSHSKRRDVAMISSGRLAVPLHRDRRADRRRQNRAGRAARHAARRDGRARGNRQSVPRRLLRRPARRRAAGAALLSAQPPPPADRRCGRPTSSARSTICDYLFDKDKIFAYLNLDDNELFIYQRLYDLLARDVPPPDLVVYLQAPTDVLLRRVRSRRTDPEAVALRARRRLPARAERGVPPLLLPLQRHAAAGRRNLAVRLRRQRRGARRSRSSRSERWARARGTTCRGPK